MDYLGSINRLRINEAVISPNESLDTIELSNKFEELRGQQSQRISLMPDSLLNREFAEYDIHFWTYEEFEKNAEPEDLKFVPGKTFAYANSKTGAIAFVGYIPSIQAFKSVIRHELIHRGQVERMNKVGGKSPPITDPVTYMNNPQEIMAFALSVYDQLRQQMPPENIIRALKRYETLPEVRNHLQKLKPESKKMFLRYLVRYAQQESVEEAL